MKHLLSLFALLAVLTCCTTEADRIRMRAGLDSINQCNRNDQPFSVADVEPYVQFFDRHGTSNERLLAHYLLGRAYHEAGEAPMALQCYQKAIDCADTLSDSCDFPQLCRVYSQTDAVLYEQGLYQEELPEIEEAFKYAMIGGDTLAALLAYEQKGKVYQKLGMADSCLDVFERVAAMYTQYHYPTFAAIVLGRTLETLIGTGQYNKAWKYLKTYETESGLFDACQNIAKGREIFYYYKGLLFLHDDQLDSAEHYFRKELHDARDYNNQNAGSLGLTAIYKKRNIPDSTAKYYQYAYAMNDSVYLGRTSEIVAKTRGIYNYSRNQELARQAEKEAARNRSIWQWGGCFALFLILVGIHIIYRIRNERQKALLNYEQSMQKVISIKKEIWQAKQDIQVLQTHKDASVELIAEKEKRIKSLETELFRHRQDTQKVSRERGLSDAEKNLRKNADYQYLISNINKGQSVTAEQWNLLEELLRQHFPYCYELLAAKRHLLTSDEYKTYILIRLHVLPSLISHIICKSEGSVTNIRIRLLKKLFNREGKAAEFDKTICAKC